MGARGRKSAADRDTPPPQLVSSAAPIALPPPPAHLSEQMQYWWREVVEAYSLEPHHLRHISARIFGHSTIIEGVARLPDPIGAASS